MEEPKKLLELDEGKSAAKGGIEDKENTFRDRIFYAVIVVLFLGFAAAFIAVGGMIVNYEAERKAVFETLKDKIIEQNSKIDAIAAEICKRNKTCP